MVFFKMDLYTKAMAIPGMIEHIEQKNLFDSVRSLKLEKDDCLIEFESFLESTFCISEEAYKNVILIKTTSYMHMIVLNVILMGGFMNL